MLLTLAEHLTRRRLNSLGILSGQQTTSVGDLHYYHTRGQQPLPPLVILHGFGASATSFARVLAYLHTRVGSILARTPCGAAVQALRSLPPGAPGQLDALIRCFDRGVAAPASVPTDSSLPPVPTDSPVVLALDFRSSRARGFPDLVARAQALAARGPAAEFAALDVDHRLHYRLAYFADRSPPAALAAQLRAAHLDLAWLHTRLLRLRGSRLWLGGWRFDVDDPLGPAAQGHLLQAWLRFAERDPA